MNDTATCNHAALPCRIIPFHRIGITLLSLFLVFGTLSGCSQDEVQVYHEPVFAGVAYVIAKDTAHLAIIDLADNKLTRLALDRPADFTAFDGRRRKLVVMTRDGLIQEIDPTTYARSPWRHLSDRIDQTAVDETGVVWVLNGKEGKVMSLAQDENKTVAVPQGTTAFSFGKDNTTILCLDETAKKVTTIDRATSAVVTTWQRVGNSPHDLLAGKDSSTLLVAEGNEYKDGKPYGVGFAKATATPGGINVMEAGVPGVKEFWFVGGNTMSLARSRDRSHIVTLSSRAPQPYDAALTMLDSTTGRIVKQYNLCSSCHWEKMVDTVTEAKAGSMAIDWDGKLPTVRPQQMER